MSTAFIDNAITDEYYSANTEETMLMKPIDPNTLGGRIALARKTRQLTQAKLAKLAGITQSSIALLESGSSKTSNNAMELAQALHVPVEWLLYGDSFDGTSAAHAPEGNRPGGQDKSNSDVTLVMHRALDSFAARLTFRREQCGLTQAQLASRSGLSQATIGNLETGRNKGTKKILELAKTLHVTPDWLVHGGNLDKARSAAVRQDFGLLPREELQQNRWQTLLNGAVVQPETEDVPSQRSAGTHLRSPSVLPIISWTDQALRSPERAHLSPSEEGYFLSPFEQSPQAFWMRISFDVMEPEYLPNDLVLVDPAVTPKSTDDIVILDPKGAPGFGRLRQTLNGRYLETLNDHYPDRMHRIEDDALVVGTVIASLRQRRAKA
ncbi:helix-turn-helix domain-containing protein [Stutzerimonas kunmingensis]|uniref:helix-turn-helix domain-containing protein n=1 Tax=Stutzerimonas kunmingensis TaxID=1211807 RepID=UPI0011B0429D|nr:XRE family transcriptional regulator [Stutzerimonas kunmingensis]